MNKTESEYASILEVMKSAGEIALFEFEPLKLRLAKSTYYTPDFMVVNQDGEVEFHEVKGFWRDDARVKIKVAADRFRYFQFIAVSKKRGKWERERF